MMSQATAGFDHDEVEPKRKVRERPSVGQDTEITERERRLMESGALASVDGLLGEAEVAAGAPANLDQGQTGRRTGIDRQQVDLGAADAELPGEAGAAAIAEAEAILREAGEAASQTGADADR